MIEVEHGDPDLERMEKDPAFTGGFDVGISKRFRHTLQIIRQSITRVKQLYQFNGLRFHKDPNSPYYAIRLNKKYRLMVEWSGEEPNEKIRTIEINNHYGDNG